MKPGARGSPGHAIYSAFLRYQKELHLYLVRRLKAAQEAEDLAQEVFLRLLRVKDIELVRSPQDYLYGIAAHVVHEFTFRNARHVVSYDSEALEEIAEASVELDPEVLADRLNLQRELQQALDTLPPMHRAVFLLRVREGASIPEIARQLDLSTHTVKKYLFKAKAQLRMNWQPQRSDDRG